MNPISKIYKLILKHKGITLLIILILVIVITFVSILPQLFSGDREKQYIDYYTENELIHTDSKNNPEFVNELYYDYTLSQSSTYSGLSFFSFFGYNNADYMKFFVDINETQWKYFRWFNLGNYWKNKWKNDGPIEQVAKNGVNKTFSGRDIVRGFQFNSNSEDTAEENVKLFIDNLSVIVNPGQTKEIKFGSHNINSSQIIKQALQNNSIVTDASITNGINYDDFGDSPFVIKINSGKIYILNGLVNKSEITSFTS